MPTGNLISSRQSDKVVSGIMARATSERVGLTASTGKKIGKSTAACTDPGAQRASRNHLKIMSAFSAYHRATWATDTSRGRRLKTDRQLLLVIPKPLRALDHPKLRSVRYPKRTLSHPLDPWQCSDAGRLLWNAIRLRSNRRACAVALWPRLGCPLPSGKRERRSTGGSLACKALAPRQQVAGRQHPSPRLRR